MSKHYHSSIMFEVTRLMNEVKEMDTEEVLSTHGIELNKDGTVFDVISEKRFDTLMMWAQSVVDEEIVNSFQHMQHKQRFDDDYM